MPAPETAKVPSAAFAAELVSLQTRVHAFVRDLVRGSLRTRGAADDIAQETMARAYRSWRTFDRDRGEMSAWLLRIAFRAFLDDRHKLQLSEPLEDQVRDHAPGPADHAHARDRAAQLLALLTDRERDVLLRFHRDGQSIQHIARALHTKDGTVKSLLHRARKRLWDNERQQEEEGR